MEDGIHIGRAILALVIVVVVLLALLSSSRSAKAYISDGVSRRRGSDTDKTGILERHKDSSYSLRVTYANLDGKEETEKFVSYVIKFLDKTYGLRELSSFLVTRTRAIDEIKTLIEHRALKSFNLQYGKSLMVDVRFIAPRVVDKLIDQQVLPAELRRSA